VASRPEERNRLKVARDWSGPSPKRFHGWEPTWVTEYEYDDTGRMVRSVTRMLEPEWDDATRLSAEALAAVERDSCPGCNMHSSILADPERNKFTFAEQVCEVCKAQEVYGRVVAARDEADRKRFENAPPSVPRPGDGRHIYLKRAD
jgi:hypothetical protein